MRTWRESIWITTKFVLIAVPVTLAAAYLRRRAWKLWSEW